MYYREHLKEIEARVGKFWRGGDRVISYVLQKREENFQIFETNEHVNFDWWSHHTLKVNGAI